MAQARGAVETNHVRVPAAAGLGLLGHHSEISPRQGGCWYNRSRRMADSRWKVQVLLAGSWRGATSVLISGHRHHIIVDTGMPHEDHQLVKALDQRGIRPEDVGAVINTHFHIDHVSNNHLFPNSLLYASQQSYDWCRSLYASLLNNENWEKLVLKYYPETFDYERARDRMAAMRKFALRWWDEGRLGDPSRFRWIETHGLPDGLEGVVTSGHVPGHVSLIVRAGNGPTVIAGDALLARELEQNVATMIPANRKQYLHDRARLLSLAPAGGLIVPGHDREFAPEPDQPPPEAA